MNGFLCLYKRSGITSFQAVAETRRIVGEKKLGHTGTLDPMAEGVLPVAFGRASKFIELLPDHEKAYAACFKLGVRTDTLDITGTVTETHAVNCTERDVIEVLPRFTGEILQVPPMYSAVSVGGVRLYKLARAGTEIERQARKVTIRQIEYRGAVGENEYAIHVTCGKGTYIRALIDDVGAALGCGAVMTRLVRTYSNGFDLQSAVTAEKLQEAAAQGRPEQLLLRVDTALCAYPAVTLSEKQTKLFKNGVRLDLQRLTGVDADGFYRIYAEDHRFLGVGETSADHTVMKMKKLYEI
ncbi:MAG: tRNA pseudouridine(55) synthase TruB [Clostridia bacterium]|nr:tRNA pseudouridine(55) synthase TruB [Clostridia bacterium]